MHKKSQDWWETQNQKMQADIKDLNQLLVQLKLQNDPIVQAAYVEVERQLNKINEDLRRHLQHKQLDASLEADRQNAQSLDKFWS